MQRLLNRMPAPWREAFESARLAQSILVTAFALVLANPMWRALIGEAGYTAPIVALAIVAAFSVTARRKAIDFTNALPASLVLYLAWATASLLWSYQPAETLWRLVNLLATTGLALYIAWARDTIQIVRGLGNVLRLLLGLSLLVEIAVAWLHPTGWRLMHISGRIFIGGPVQGVFGARGVLAFMALIALFTFAIEWRTRSVRPWVGATSLALAIVCLALASSPISFVAAAIVVVAAGMLWLLRRSKPRVRWGLNVTFAFAGLFAMLLAWINRVPIIMLLDGRGETSLRVHVWQQMSKYLFNNPLQGWGFSGGWWVGGPYQWVQQATDKTLGSSMNAYIDVYFQLGAIGLVLFITLLGTALVRTWILASNRRSVIYLWPALAAVTLVIVSFADSFVLSGGGWMLLVVAAVKAARELTWGDALRTRSGAALPSRAGR